MTFIIVNTFILSLSVIIVSSEHYESDQNKVLNTQLKPRFSRSVGPVLERTIQEDKEQSEKRRKQYQRRNRLRPFSKRGELSRVSRYSVFDPPRYCRTFNTNIDDKNKETMLGPDKR